MAIIPDDPKQRNALLIAVVLLAGLYFFYEYWYSGRAEEVDGMATHLEQLEDRNRQARIIAARGGSQLEERMRLYERHVARLEELIPAQEEVPALLEAIERQAVTHGVELSSMRPAASQPGQYYTRRSYDLTVVGEYHDVGRFLTSIASLPRIITPRALDLERFSDPRGVTEFEAPVTGTFQIETYVLPAEGTAPQAGAGGGGQTGGNG